MCECALSCCGLSAHIITTPNQQVVRADDYRLCSYASHTSHPVTASAKSLACEVCGQVFKHRHNMLRHMRGHMTAYPCQICARPFKRKDNLKQHELSHNTEGHFHNGS